MGEGESAPAWGKDNISDFESGGKILTNSKTKLLTNKNS
jgi:hypothetical protein